jgi:hypothetical protein
MIGSLRLAPALAFALVGLIAAPGGALAKPAKKKAPAAPAAAAKGPACGISFLPLVEGNEWTYQFFVPENFQMAPGLHIAPIDTLKIKVVKVEPAADGTKITVEETYRKVVAQSVLTCNADHLLVAPESFFFAGEPGGGLGIQLDKLQRKGESFLIKTGLKESTYEEFKATAVRKPTEGSGAQLAAASLELERKMTVKGIEPVESGMGQHKAIRVDLQITGRATLEVQKGKPFNMPEVGATMWFEPGTGIVRVESRLGNGWRLTDFKPAGRPE